MDINEIIADIIKTTVQNELALRMRPLADKQHRDTEEMLRRINELAADIGRWKGQRLELPEQRFKEIHDRIDEVDRGAATETALQSLEHEVRSLRRQLEALDQAKAKDDERFQDDVVSVLDQDNMDAKIREVVTDVLHETLPQAVADAFTDGSLTISVDKV